MNSRTRTHLISGGLIALVFLCGVVAGYAVHAYTSEDILTEADLERQEERHAWVIERVGLTSDQRQEVDSIVEDYRFELTGVVEEYRHRYGQLVAEARQEVESVLTEEQREEYRAHLERREGHGEGEAEAAADRNP